MSDDVRNKTEDDERFKDAPPLNCGDVYAEVDNVDSRWMDLDIDGEYLTIREARALRDWLNQVLP